MLLRDRARAIWATLTGWEVAILAYENPLRTTNEVLSGDCLWTSVEKEEIVNLPSPPAWALDLVCGSGRSPSGLAGSPLSCAGGLKGLQRPGVGVATHHSWTQLLFWNKSLQKLLGRKIFLLYCIKNSSSTFFFFFFTEKTVLGTEIYRKVVDFFHFHRWHFKIHFPGPKLTKW